MEKLKEYLEKWFNGEKVRGFDVSPMEIYLLYDIYRDISNENKERIEAAMEIFNDLLERKVFYPE